MRRTDRRLLVTIGGCLIVGVSMLIVGLWVVLHPPIDWNRGGPIGFLLMGPGLIVIATAELLHRVRHGPQKPGRRVHRG